MKTKTMNISNNVTDMLNSSKKLHNSNYLLYYIHMLPKSKNRNLPIWPASNLTSIGLLMQS